MNLYENQSAGNPNMPLRGLFYFSSLYRAYVAERNLDIYSSVHLKLPTPQYIVFYSGQEDEPEYKELTLSDSFVPVKEGGHSPDLECVAHVLTINYGHDQKLMKKCRKLYEYSYFVASIRRKLAEGLTLTAAVEYTVPDCIQKDILKEFLIKHGAEVTEMILEELDMEFHLSNERRIHYEEGFIHGQEKGARKNGFSRSAASCKNANLSIPYRMNWRKILRKSVISVR